MTRDPRRLRGATGIFGGTFDPIHLAHLAIAEAARDAFDLHRVLFVVAARPPHKPGVSITPVDDRLAMVEAAVADNAAFETSRIEVDRDGPSYTVDTLAAVHARHVPGVPMAGITAALPTATSRSRLESSMRS